MSEPTIYSWLTSIGARGLGESETNRPHLDGYLRRFTAARCETLLKELKLAQRTAAERKAAWRAKHEREWARKKQKRLCQK